MNQNNPGKTSSALSIHPLKRRRGRPRKDPNLKPTHAHAHTHAHAYPHSQPPPGFQSPDRVNSMVGEAVTGVVEATFDAGYLLTVRIGNSTTNLRGLVFKPGHYVPVTSENDIAPNLPMIGRNNFNAPHPKNNLAIQTVRQKRKYVRKAASAASVPPVGVRGTVVPVVLQPVNVPDVSTGMPSTGHVMDFGDKDVHMAEPLAILPPAQDRSIPVGQIFVAHKTQQVSQTNENGGENVKKMELSGVDNMGSGSGSGSGSSETSDSGREDSTIASKQETENTNRPFLNESLLSYGAGRMTELLQAVQENTREQRVQIAEPRSSEADPKPEATVP